jgi:hypothetical protein
MSAKKFGNIEGLYKYNISITKGRIKMETILIIFGVCVGYFFAEAYRKLSILERTVHAHLRYETEKLRDLVK